MINIRNLLIQFIFLLGLALFFLNSSSGRATAAGDGNTGAPGETGLVCGTCHAGGTFGGTTTTFTLKDMTGSTVTSYVAGQTYDLTVSVNPEMGIPSGYGFQMTALDGNNANAG
ncbi:MAG: hypothetical protein AB8G22_27640, partial [Saprospiraceae bacterium]